MTVPDLAGLLAAHKRQHAPAEAKAAGRRGPRMFPPDEVSQLRVLMDRAEDEKQWRPA
jgi:hypothetical protein